MALVVKDRVKETSTSIGTANFTLAGAVDGFQAFSAALANGDTTYYAITDAGTGDFEVGLGTYNAGVITRTTILESTNAGAAVNFQSGEKEVFITYPAEKAVYADASGNISVPGLVDGRDIAADGSKLDGIESGATADQTGAEIKSLYEAQANTNAYTDAEKSKLAGIEAGATADQTASEIKTAYESNANTNVFTDAEQSKLAGIEAGADVTDTANVTAAGALMDSEVTNLAAVKAFDPTDYATAAQGALADSALQSSDIGVSVQGYSAVLAGTTASYTTAEEAKLAGIEAGATADQTAAEIKTAYESNANTNAFTDAEKTKLSGIEAGATAGQTASEILTAIKTVDGSTSGLDADLLDGQHATAFATAAQGALADSAVQPGDNISTLTNNSGYITGNQTITLSGDVSGSGTTSIVVTVADDSHNHVISNVDGLQAALDAKLDDTQKGAANGLAELDATGKVPSAQLPSYVDDVLEYAAEANFPATGETGKLYVALDTNDVYRWTGSAYVKVSDAVSTADQATKLATARNIALGGDVSGSANFDGSANITITATVADDSHNHVISNIDGLQTALDAKADDTTTISAGSGLTGGGSLAANRTISHADTSTQASLTALTGANVVSDIDLDTYGHVTSLATRAMTLADLGYTGETNATADQTAAEIKTAYESNADTNAYTDAEKTKLSGIEAGADVTDTANVTAAGALMTTGGTMSGPLKQAQTSITASTASTTVNFASSNDFVVTMSSATTFTFSNVVAGQSGVIYIKQDATGGYSFTLPAIAKTPKGGATIAQVTTANSINVISYTVLDSSNVLVNYIGDFQ